MLLWVGVGVRGCPMAHGAFFILCCLSCFGGMLGMSSLGKVPVFVGF